MGPSASGAGGKSAAEGGLEEGLEDVGLAEEAQVARVRAVRGAVGVVAVQVVAGHVGQALDAFFHELCIGGLQRGMVVVVMLAEGGLEP